MTSFNLFAFAMPGHFELLIIGAIALLLFGNRLPKIARSFGQTIVEFKKGVAGITDDLDGATEALDDVDRQARQAVRDVKNA